MTIHAPAESPVAVVQVPAWTWEQAVRWLRDQPDQQELVRACYYDDPLLEAARRFRASDEWRSVSLLLPLRVGEALDLGAGRGISSYALARDGWNVAAVEPDPSELVGAGAIRRLARDADLAIRIIQTPAEELPFTDGSFDLVYGRQVLHHARDLRLLCREAARVLKPGGRLVVTREHVISHPADLPAFLAAHPLHRFYGGEHAYLLEDYSDAITSAGLRLVQTFGPFDAAINYFPMSFDEWQERCRRPLARVIGRAAAAALTHPGTPSGRRLLQSLARRLSRRCQTPGRLYSFLAEKPT